MKSPPGYVIDVKRLAARVREIRGERSLRDVAAELGIGAATLSRVENAKMPPDMITFGRLCHWIGDHPKDYFILEPGYGNDPIVTQLRAAQAMSGITAEAFLELARAAYEQALAWTDEDERS